MQSQTEEATSSTTSTNAPSTSSRLGQIEPELVAEVNQRLANGEEVDARALKTMQEAEEKLTLEEKL